LIDHTKISAVVINADRAAIQSFVATAPTSPIALNFKEIAVPNLAGLTYVFDA